MADQPPAKSTWTTLYTWLRPEEDGHGTFLSNLINRAGSALDTVVFDIVTMFYCLMDPNTPFFAKLLISGAFAYLASPVDAIPDVLPGGYVDDVSALILARATIAHCITEQHEAKATAWLRRFRHWHPQ